jgi:hypothetical protein
MIRSDAHVQWQDACEWLPDLVQALSASTAAMATELARDMPSGAETRSLHDAMLTCHCLQTISILAVKNAALQAPELSDGLRDHAGRLQSAVMASLPQAGAPERHVDVEEVCEVLSTAFLDADGNDQAAGSSKRARPAQCDWASTPQSAVLHMLCNTAHDLAVSANTAVDTLEKDEASATGGTPAEDAEAAKSAAVHACREAWDAATALMEMHMQFAMLHVGDTAMQPMLLQLSAQCIAAVTANVEAVLRGTDCVHQDNACARTNAISVLRLPSQARGTCSMRGMPFGSPRREPHLHTCARHLCQAAHHHSGRLLLQGLRWCMCQGISQR